MYILDLLMLFDFNNKKLAYFYIKYIKYQNFLKVNKNHFI